MEIGWTGKAKISMASKVIFASLDVEVDTPELPLRSQLISTLQATQPPSDLTLSVPSWVTKPSLLLYLSLLSPSPPTLDLPSALSSIRIASYLEDEVTTEQLLASPSLSTFAPDTILPSFTLATENCARSPAWAAFYTKALAYAKGHIGYLIERCSSALLQVPKGPLETLLVESLKTDFGRPVVDHTPIVRMLKSVWGTPNLPEMLEKVEKQAISTLPTSTALQWTVQLKAGTQFYESPEFELEGLTWVFQMWYYGREDRLDCFLGNGVGERQHIPGALVALTLNLSFFDDDCLTETRLITILLGSKGHKLARSVHGLANRLPNGELKVTAKVRLEYAYSALFTYLATHFEDQTVSDRAGKLHGERILQLLSMKQLNVSSEDAVLRLLGQWSERHRSAEDLSLQLEDLLDTVRWAYVSTKCLLDCCRVFPALKSSPVFRDAIYREFASRCHLRVRNGDLQAPRASYSGLHHSDFVTNYNVFVSDICTLLVGMDFTPVLDLSTEIESLQRTLYAKELQAKCLRDSLGIVRRVLQPTSTMPTPHMSMSAATSPDMFKGDPYDDSMDERMYKNHSYTRETISTAPSKSAKRNLSLDQNVEAPLIDVKVSDMLSSFWAKIEEKSKQVDSDRS